MSEPPRRPEFSPSDWTWRGYKVAWIHQGPERDSDPGALRDAAAEPAVILIHGFGACIAHWRHNIQPLAQSHHVFALDLLGFGASDKPPSRLPGEEERPGAVIYCFDLWAEQVADFVMEHVLASAPDRPFHLVGNSIGGLIALNAALMLIEKGCPPAQVVLIDCTQRGLDEKRILELPLWERATRPLVKQLVSQRWLIFPLFRFIAKPTFIRMVLKQAYPSGANVDDELVMALYRPTSDPGAMESFRGFINLFDDHIAPDLLARLSVPVRMIWGEKDPWENPEEARNWKETFGCVQDLMVLPGLGHCPHDEGPEQVNPILLRWLNPAVEQKDLAELQ